MKNDPFRGLLFKCCPARRLMAKKCSKNELFNVERQVLESYMSAFEEMKKVEFRSITKVETQYSLIKFVMPLTLSAERLSMSRINPPCSGLA